MKDVNLNNLPNWLKENGRFCYWKYEERPGKKKPGKAPCSPKTGEKISISALDKFGSFNDILDYAVRGYDGVGISIGDGICAVDIDYCLNDDAIWSDMAMDICQIMQTYTEISPGGRGLRLLFRATGFQYNISRYFINNNSSHLEVYVSGATPKFVTVTGDALFPGADLEERGPQLQTVLERYMARPVQDRPPVPAPPQGSPPMLDDEAVIRAASRGQYGEIFEALMSGDITAYDNDHSRADQALCGQLAFYTGRNAEQMDRIFRASGLMRPKWDERRGDVTYGQLTLQRAVDTPQTIYQPPVPPAPPTVLPDLQPVSIPASALPPVPQVVTVNATATATVPYAAMTGSGLISALELQQLDLPPTVYLVEGILPAGVTILSAAPKQGKSWLVLDMGVCIAAGTSFWGHKTTQCGVLYLALEDSRSRLQARLNQVLAGQPAPPNFYFVNDASTLDAEVGEPLLVQLENYLTMHPDVKLVIIDTFQKIRGAALRGETPYAYDYRETGLVKKFADDRGISILFVHHNRKMTDESDSFNMISGTNGIMGAADTSWVITNSRRTDEQSTLNITGRDVEQAELAIRFDKDTCRWELIGSQADVNEARARAEYEANPVVQTVRKLLSEAPQHRWSGQAKDVLEAMDDAAEWNPQKIGYALRELGDKLLKYDRIVYSPRDTNGTGGKVHEFVALDAVMSSEQAS